MIVLVTSWAIGDLLGLLFGIPKSLQRKGAGRKREKEKLAKDRTKVIRVSESEYIRIKNGSYKKI